MNVKERSNNASMRSSLPYRTYCVQTYAIPFGKCRIRFGAFPYMPHIVVRQLASSAQLPAKHIASVQDVLSTGAPFKVLDGVVSLVAVDMVHLRPAIIVRYERLCDKPVDALCFRCAHVAQQNKMVSVCVHPVGKNLFRLHAMEASIRPVNRAFEAFDATATGYLIASFVACYVAPFLHRMHLLRLALPRNGHPITC